MNEFDLHSKRLNIKNGKLKKKKKNWEISKIMVKKFTHSYCNLFSGTPKNQSKRIIETEPTRWLQSKYPLKSEWIRHFN